MDNLTYLHLMVAIAAWGLAALLLLILLRARGKRLVFTPILREDVRSTTCRNCRLPFHRTSWRCGRCGAFIKPGLVYWFGRRVIEPVTLILIAPWIVSFGIVLSIIMGITSIFIPRAHHITERIANRMGSWVAPLFPRWVPRRWRIFRSGALLEPGEVDVPIEAVTEAALTLAICMIGDESEEVEVKIAHPIEETLEILRQNRGGIHEIWGYVSDGHVLFPTYEDKIVGTRFNGNDLIGYSGGLAHHLERPQSVLEIRPVAKEGGNGDEGAKWTFLLRREFDLKGRYPVTWEVNSAPEILLQIESTIEDLTSWDSLPCRLSFR